MFGLGITELIVVLAVVLLVFGPSRLPHMGKGIGSAIKNFRGALSEKEESVRKENIT